MACFLVGSVKLRYSMGLQVFFGQKTYTTIWTRVFSITCLSPLWSVWIWVFKSSFVWKLTPQSVQGSFQIFSPCKFFHFLLPLQNTWTLLSYTLSLLFDEFSRENFSVTGLQKIKICRSTLRMLIRRKYFKAHLLTLSFN